MDPESDAPDFFYYYYVGCVSHSDAFFFPFKTELLFSTEISTNSKFDKMKFQSFFSQVKSAAHHHKAKVIEAGQVAQEIRKWIQECNSINKLKWMSF